MKSSLLLRCSLIWLAASASLAALQTGPLFSIQIPGSSMEPTLRRGQFVEVEAITLDVLETLDRGSIVVFEAPTEDRQRLIKRIVGMPGDALEIRDKRLFRNAALVEEAYVQYLDPSTAQNPEDALFARDQLRRTVVPPGKLFVLGDNRDRSFDSRSFGPIRLESILGRVR